MFILVDIEAVGSDSKSVFCIGVLIAEKVDSEPDDCEVHMFYLTPEPNSCKGGPWLFWNNDPERKAFYESSLEKAKRQSNEKTITQLRELIDDKYTKDTIVFISDKTEYDIGMVNSLLEDHGKLHLDLKTEYSPPVDCIDYKLFLKGLAHNSPWSSSSDARKKLKVDFPSRQEDHDTEKDLKIMWDEFRAVMRKSKDMGES